MSNLVDHATDELKRAGLFDADSDYGGMLGTAVLDLIRLFSEQDHSGASAGMVSALFDKLSRFRPLGPLTGDDDEWNEVGDGVWQNRRCSHVFKNKDGAYDIQGRIFEDPDGSRWQNGESHVPVTFPYTPTQEIVKRSAQ